MSSYNWPAVGGGNGVAIYPTASAFPSGSQVGELAVAADTGAVYEWRGSSWVALADPAFSPLAITALTGDGTATGPGSVALTLATVNSNVGSFTNSTITVNAKGLITAASSGATGNLTDVGTDGIVITGGTGAILGSGTSIAQHVADATHNGYLNSTDWSTFNNKQASGNYITDLTGDVTASGPGSAASTLATVNGSPGSFGSASTSLAATVNGKGLITSLASQSIQIAESQVTNLVSDLASKVATSSLGNLTDVGTDGIVVTGGTGAVVGSVSLAQHVADSTHNGYLSSTDWSTFNSKGSGTVTAVSVSSSNGFTGSSSGGSTPALTLATSVTGIVKGNGTALSAATTTSHNVLIGAGAADFTNVAPSATSGVALVSAGASSDPAFGTVAIAGGGTGQVTKAAAFDALSPNSVKGDTTIYSTTNARQAVPGDYGRLIPDSTATNGWRSASYTQTLDGKPGKNYIQYADIENNSTTGWTLGTVGTLTNGLPTGTPTFGSGASGNLSLSVISSGQLAGTYSLGYASSAATTSGNMVASSSYAIDIADQAKVLTVKFSYNMAVGATNVNSSGTSSNSYAWAVYDVTNSSWLTSAGNFNLVQNSGVGYCTGTVQTNATTANIRLVVYNANATAGAASMYLDDFYVGPQTSPVGPSMSDWTSFTPTGSFVSNSTYTGVYRRVGDTLEVEGKIAFSGAPTTTTLTINLPSGLVIDTTKISGQTNNDDLIVGTAQSLDASTQDYNNQTIVYSSTTAVSIRTGGVSGSNITTGGTITQAVPFTFGTGDAIRYAYRVPIVGWSSNSVQSSDTDTRVIAAVYTLSGSQSISNTTSTAVIWNSVAKDTAGGMNTSTGVYTVPVTGFYSVTGFLNYASNSTGIRYVQVNSIFIANQSAVSGDNTFSPFTYEAFFNAGSTITVQAYQSSGGPLNINTSSQVNITRVSGPAVISATESVSCRYENTAATSITNSFVTVPFATKVWDTHNAFNGSTGTYTAPVSGKYSVSSSVHLVATIATSNGLGVKLLKNGSTQYAVNSQNGNGGTNEDYTGIVNTLVDLLAGDTVIVQARVAPTTGLSTSAGDNYFTIVRIGN